MILMFLRNKRCWAVLEIHYYALFMELQKKRIIKSIDKLFLEMFVENQQFSFIFFQFFGEKVLFISFEYSPRDGALMEIVRNFLS